MQLDDENTVVARSHGLRVRSVYAERREADFVASTDAIDSWGEIVEQTWRLERYRSNPVVLYAHQSRDLPIGTATMCEVLDGQLVCRIKFVTDDKNPKAEQVWRMVRDGELRAVSVGFQPHSYKYEKREDREVLVLSDNELHEISVVPIPANPDALAKMKAKALAAAGTTNPKAPAAETESNMTEKEMQEQLAKAAADKAFAEKHASEVSKVLEAAQATAKALEAQNSTLVKERDAAVERANKAESAVIELEVEALVGTKITPAEKDDFIALRKTNPELFTKFVAQRADKKLLENVIPTKLAPVVATGDAGEPDLFAGSQSA